MFILMNKICWDLIIIYIIYISFVKMYILYANINLLLIISMV